MFSSFQTARSFKFFSSQANIYIFFLKERQRLEELEKERQATEQAMREANEKLHAAEEASRRAAEEAKKKAREITTCTGLARPIGPHIPAFVTHRGIGAFCEDDFDKINKRKKVPPTVKPKPKRTAANGIDSENLEPEENVSETNDENVVENGNGDSGENGEGNQGSFGDVEQEQNNEELDKVKETPHQEAAGTDSQDEMTTHVESPETTVEPAGTNDGSDDAESSELQDGEAGQTENEQKTLLEDTTAISNEDNESPVENEDKTQKENAVEEDQNQQDNLASSEEANQANGAAMDSGPCDQVTKNTSCDENKITQEDNLSDSADRGVDS